ncbi:hypothetical protein [Rhodanobacter aciditrophus]|uniref:hypothetical protein n=1 Tax=Rhodanobacter aciditrophus TaxID=1623218 RepID=UPI003CE94303
MKPATAANLALVLVVIGGVLGSYGALSQLGDPAPWVTAAQLDAMRRRSLLFMLVGMLAPLCSLWLAGYSFHAARIRALAASILCLVQPVALFLWMLW